MKINDTEFGSITIDGKTYDGDVIVRPAGVVEKRRKKLSKKYYGTSHRVSLEEAKFVWEPGCPSLIIGTGQYGALSLSEEAAAFLEQHHCAVTAEPTPQAISLFNKASQPKAGLFHVTC